MKKENGLLLLAGLAPLVVMAGLCWHMNEKALTGVAMTAARSAVAETERYFDRIAAQLSTLDALKGRPCDADTIETLDHASIKTLVVHDIGLYDSHLQLYCSGHGPRSLDLSGVKDRRIAPIGVDVVFVDSSQWTIPAILVDLAWPDGSGVAAITDLALFTEMAPPFALGEDRALVLRLADGTLLRRSGLDQELETSGDLHVTAISSRFGVTAEVAVPAQVRWRDFFERLVLFEVIGATVSAALVWLVSMAFRGRHSITRGLKAALKDGQLEVHYQPVIDLQAGRCVGAEALLRWRHPEHGLIKPDLFIPVAEESGLILPMTRWAMTCIRADFDRPDLPADFHVAINLTPQHLANDDIVKDVEAIFSRPTLPPENIILEVTERSPIGPEGGKVIEALQGIGPGVAVDDFGTGHSGLAYLQKYRFDFLKIDQSFVKSIGTDAVNLTVVDAIIKLGQDLGIAIIAEGIETEEQFLYLQKQGVQMGQGWLFAKALPIHEFLGFLQQFRQAPASVLATAAL